MATNVNLTTKRESGKTITKSFPCVNPDATNAQITQFFVALNSLSNNTIIPKGIQKVVKTDLDID